MLEHSALQESADRGIRTVALTLLATAEDAGKALHASADSVRDGAAADDDLLHDFRVALRRLRSWLRAFDSSLGDTVRRKHERRLRSIVRSTNAARDATVHA
ncbi:MAG TPA: CHAD domain-containing protein, partial [Gemmatimonadaceae bacterium]|nr:CHAD domain-containing protein [Gemmatimonadaceae bacterium]